MTFSQIPLLTQTKLNHKICFKSEKLQQFNHFRKQKWKGSLFFCLTILFIASYFSFDLDINIFTISLHEIWSITYDAILKSIKEKG